MNKRKNQKIIILLASITLSGVLLSGCGNDQLPKQMLPTTTAASNQVVLHDSVLPIESLPQFNGVPYTAINNNIPFFKDKEKELAKTDFLKLVEKDSFGRCGTLIASISPQSIPSDIESTMGDVEPSGWHITKYDGIEGQFLYNRCLLIPANFMGIPHDVDKEMITATRYLCKIGLIPFNDRIYKYIQKTGNHVLYRATPLFSKSDLLARGILLEAYSVEDKGEGLQFCVFVYNAQPGIEIDYSTGNSKSVNESIKELSSAVTGDLTSDYDSTKKKKKLENMRDKV